MRALLVIVAAFAITACDFDPGDPKLQEGQQCQTQSECASGLTCRTPSNGSQSRCVPT
jgi:hypothetical protein